jgi:hypothetical protein
MQNANRSEDKMALPTRHMLTGMFFGAAAATGLAALGPGVDIRAMADEMFPSFDASRLMKFDDALFDVETDPGISTKAQSVAHVRKIEFGRASTVNIVTTASGTYSTDAMFSSHIRYPGIDVHRLTGPARPITSVAFWSDTSGWVVAPLLNAQSVLVLNN